MRLLQTVLLLVCVDTLALAADTPAARPPASAAGSGQVANLPHAAAVPLAWPQATSTTRPWSYWWWLGSAVDKENITRELTRYRDAGWGGVHIIPIYGAKGWEPKFINYLSPQWLEMLGHSVGEARRLGMDVDMTTGTGWPFGGPSVTLAETSSKLVLAQHRVAGGEKLAAKLPPRYAPAATAGKADGDGKITVGKGAVVTLESLVAVCDDGKRLDLTAQVTADGQLPWVAPPGQWQLFVLARQAPLQRVKRAAPGAEGWVLDPFSPAAMKAYLDRFDAALADYHGPRPRAQYHDSYEYFNADWSPALLEEFAKRRGYDLRSQLPAFSGQGDADVVARVKCDYRQTISELHLEFLKQWTNWARARKFLTRNQAHGSPGNLLDHYAVADIPETEMYAGDRSMLVSKLASSAAHVVGRKLTSSETGTWLKQHFTVTLGDLKLLLDEFFVAGVNHVIFHGTVYSPDEAPWPGFLFYAATQLNPRNSIWRDAPALAAYIARCQSILQAGQPDNDVLLYWPIHDLWHNPQGMLTGNSVHHRAWFEEQPFGRLAKLLWQRGYAFDYVSDWLLVPARADGGAIRLNGRYQAIVVPACEHLPVETWARLLDLVRAGATVIFAEHLPGDVPGLADLPHRRELFRQLLAEVKLAPAGQGVQSAALGQGRILVGDVEAALAQTAVRREALADAGCMSIRRTFAGGWHYFVVNRSDKPLDGWLPLATQAQAAMLLDPLTAQAGVAALRPRAGGSEVFVQLPPNGSVIVRLLTAGQPAGPAWTYRRAAGPATTLAGTWDVKFSTGGPELPPPFQAPQLQSWTAQGGAAERFAGTAVYRLKFAAPAGAHGPWQLDLGQVAQSARVRLNGRDLGALLLPPYQVVVETLDANDNLLEVEVTSVAANRIRDLDRRGEKWRYFYDINFIGIGGKPFDASGWPLTAAGLLGPVTLQPLKAVAAE